jgi:hypothetical protein
MKQFAYRHMVASGYGRHPSTGMELSVVRVVFVAGHATFYVRLPDSTDGDNLDFREPVDEFGLLFDPSAGNTLLWPRGTLDDTGITETMNRHIHGGIYPGQDMDRWAALT